MAQDPQFLQKVAIQTKVFTQHPAEELLIHAIELCDTVAEYSDCVLSLVRFYSRLGGNQEVFNQSPAPLFSHKLHEMKALSVRLILGKPS